MLTLRLPRLGGTRDAADSWLDSELGENESIRNELVVLLGRDLLSSSESFADQTVKRLMEDESAREIILVAPPQKLEADILASARRRGFAASVRRDSAASLGV